MSQPIKNILRSGVNMKMSTKMNHVHYLQEQGERVEIIQAPENNKIFLS